MNRKKQNFVTRWMCLLLIAAMFGVVQKAMAVDVVTLTSSNNAKNIALRANTIYNVLNDVTITADATYNALAVDENATVTIYIAKGKTLTVKGGNANGRIAAGAGIYVPQTSTLIITGEGELKATGGKAGAGGNGGAGGNAWRDNDTRDSDRDFKGGQGGFGGYGGGGAAAAIGGSGGNGHDILEGPEGPKKHTYHDQRNGKTWSIERTWGYKSQIGENGKTMGNVYVMGNVTVDAQRGYGNTTVGAGSTQYGNNMDCKRTGLGSTYHAGGGGPGGGGGSGYAASYGIGGGAPGAQCGATGSSGGLIKGESWYRLGHPGQGGKGYKDGGNAKSFDINNQWHTHRIEDVAVKGGNGKFYSTRAGLEVGERKIDEKKEYKDLPAMVKTTINFDLNGGSGNIPVTEVYYGDSLVHYQLKALLTNVKKEDRVFEGFWTRSTGGEQVITANGTPKQPICTYTTRQTFYAHWSEKKAVNPKTGVAYKTSIQDALNAAKAGDEIRMNESVKDSKGNLGDLVITKPVTLDMNGFSVNSLFIRETSATVTVSNGKVNHFLEGYGGTDKYTKGPVELNNMSINNIASDAHGITINGGVYGTIYNTVIPSFEKHLDIVSIKGKSFIANFNQAPGQVYGEIRLTGGCYRTNPETLDPKFKVKIPANYEVKKLAKAPKGAPSADYVWVVVQKQNFTNFVHLKEGHTDLKLKANNNTKMTAHIRLNNMPYGYIPVMGSTDNNDPEQALAGFGVYIDGRDGSFVYGSGAAFHRSAAGLAKAGKDYWITLKKGLIQIDTVASGAKDYLHEEIVMYKLQDSGNTLCLGAVNGSNYASNLDMYVYDAVVYEGENEIAHFKPAYGYLKGNNESDVCFYETVKNQTYYCNYPNVSETRVAYGGAMGQCATHETYRIVGTGTAAKRICAICGDQQEVEDKFIECEGSTSATYMWKLPCPATANNPMWKIHRGSLSNDDARIETTKMVPGTPGQDITVFGERVFSYELWSGNKQLANYVPHSSCGKYYLHDTVSDIYLECNNQNATANFDRVKDHEMETVTLSGIETRACKICQGRNCINLRGEILFDLGVQNTTNISTKMTFSGLQGIERGQRLIGSKNNGNKNINVWINEVNGTGFKIEGDCNGSTSIASNLNETLQSGKFYTLEVKYGNNNSSFVKSGDVYQYCYKENMQDQGNIFIGNMFEEYPSAHISVGEVILTMDNQEFMHLLPSKYNNKPCFYDIYTGMIIEPKVKDGITLSEANIENFCDIEECPEHIYLTTEATLENGAYYRTCMICNAKVQDTRKGFTLAENDYIDTEYKPVANTSVLMTYKAGNKVSPSKIETVSTTDKRPSYCAAMSASYPNESANNLVDGNGTKTKWCSRWISVENPWIVVDNGASEILKGYKLYSANDTEGNPDRRWKSWTVEGSNSSVGPWQTIDSRSDQEMSSKNFAENSYSITNNNSKFRYYRFTINNIEGYLCQQMSDLKLTVEITEETTQSGTGSPCYIYSSDSYAMMQAEEANKTYVKYQDKDKVYTYADNLVSSAKDHIKTQEISAGAATKSIKIGANPDFNYKAADVKVYAFCILEGETLVRNFIPAIQDGKAGMLETISQKFYPIQNHTLTDAEKSAFGTCDVHQYWSLSQSINEYGDEVCTRTCRVCGYQELLTGTQGRIMNNGADWFNTGYRPNSKTKATMTFEVNAEQELNEQNVIFGDIENNSTASFGLSINPIGHIMQPSYSKTQYAANKYKQNLQYYVEMDASGTKLYEGTNADGTLAYSGANTATLAGNTNPIYIGTQAGVSQKTSDITFSEFCIYENGTLLHRYLPSIWQGKVQLYDAIADKFIESGKNVAQAYVPTCSFHRYYVLETEGTGADIKAYRHCKLCNARIALNGIRVNSQEDFRKYVYDDTLAVSTDGVSRLNNTMYVDMLSTAGEADVVLCKNYPAISKDNVVFGIAVMNEGKLMENHQPARRHEGNGFKYGMFNTVNSEFKEIPNSTTYFTNCGHNYKYHIYEDTGLTRQHCYLCDETQDSIVGYHLDITYFANRADGDTVKTTQVIYWLKDGSDTTNKQLNRNPWVNGAHFVGDWNTQKDGNGTAHKADSEMTPSEQLRGKFNLYAKWDDGVIYNNDTIRIELTGGVHQKPIDIKDNGQHIFNATANFKAKTVTFTRDLTNESHRWGTLCLPFAVKSTDQMKLYTASRLNIGANKTAIVLDEANEVQGGVPCIYQLTADATSMTITSENVDMVCKPGTQKVDGQIELIGSYDYNTFECKDTDTKYYFGIQDDKFKRTTRQVTVRPYRAHIEAPKSSSAASRGTLYLLLDDEVTGIETIDLDSSADYEYYDLQGRRVNDVTDGQIVIRRNKKSGTSVKIKK